MMEAETLFDNIIVKNYPHETVLTIIQGKGTVPRNEAGRNIHYDEQYLSNYKLVNKDDYIIHLRSFEGGLELANSNGIVSPAYTVLRCKKPFTPIFYDAYFHTNEFINHVLYKAVEGIRDGRQISYEAFKWLKIPYCSKAEQDKIAGLFQVLNERIAKQQELVECFKSYKRGAIAHYFTTQMRSTKCTKTTISKCLFYEQPQKYIVHSEHYSNAYTTPVLTANKAFILGYTNETDGIYDKGEVLIYDDFTMEVKYVNFPFKVKSSTIKMLTPQTNIDLYFMFSLLQFLELKPEGHQRSYISILEPTEVEIPAYDEQVRAAKLFRLLDGKIAKEQLLLQEMVKMKSSLMQQLFI